MFRGGPAWAGFAILLLLALPGTAGQPRAQANPPENTGHAAWICVRTSPPGAAVRASGGDGCDATPCMIRGGRRDVLVMRKYGYMVARIAVTPQTNGVYARLKKRPDTTPPDEAPLRPVPDDQPGGVISARIHGAADRPPGCAATHVNTP